MSETDLARRTSFEVFFAGVDITSSLQQYFLSLSYVDNEEDETDDLQISLQDRSGIWVEQWLNTAIHAAANEPIETVIMQYRVIAQSGATVHSEKKTDSKSLGSLAYGTVITPKSKEDGWIGIDYPDKSSDNKDANKTGYIQESNLQPIYMGKGATVTSQTSASTTSSSEWNIGDEVTVTGRPQLSSYGEGTPGAMVTNYTGTITYLNLKDGVPYPIHVGYLGWFAIDQVQGANNGGNASGEQNEDEASKGLRIQASITRHNWRGNGETERLDCGQFELDSVVASGPPATVTIKGTSLPYSRTIRQTKKSKSWESYTFSGIANEIADNNGMTCMFLSGTDPSYERVEQYRISDIAFLQKLCQDAGFSLKITNNIIVVFDQATYESREPVLVIKRGKEGGYSKYKLSTGENNVYTSCRVRYVDPDGNLISATAYVEDYEEKTTENSDELDNKNKKENQCLEIRQKVSNAEEAEALAQKMLRLYNKYEFSASFTFPFNPELLAGLVVVLEGWGAFDRRYIIKQANHKVSNSGSTTQITLRSTLEIANPDEAAAGASGTKSIDELAKEVIRGDWGNGEERRRRLTEAGYDYDAVQKRVNEILL